jgi:hypothetical protein
VSTAPLNPLNGRPDCRMWNSISEMRPWSSSL